MSRLRAIEHGRALIHISTTGPSAMISPTGIVLAATGAFTQSSMNATLPLRQTVSPAARWSRLLGWGFVALAAALVLAGAVRVRTRNRL
jgi:apolipoprotein N-acyltransferase